MLFYCYFSILLMELITFSYQNEINYTIYSSSINIDYCNLEEGTILFHIDAKIDQNPYCNIKFNLSLLEPSYSKAECTIYDDINNRINCSLTSKDTSPKIIKIEKQFIKLNSYRVSVNLLDFPNNSININCNTFYINIKVIIKFIYIFILIFCL